MNYMHDTLCSCIIPLFHDLSLAISGGKPLSGIMDIAVKLLVEKLQGVERVVLAIRCRKTDLMFIENGWGLNDEELARGIYQIGEGITGQVALSGRSVLVPVIAEEPGFLDRTKARIHRDTRKLAFICVPIKLGHEILGTLSIDKDNRNSSVLSEDLHLLEILACILAQAVELQRSKNEENAALREENRRLQRALSRSSPSGKLIGNSNAMRSIYDLIAKVALRNTPVLILGESGTGKELVAGALHQNSPRSKGSFVRFNCAAISETLAESEMFGHEKGAFTGAYTLRRGRFEEADGGTLFMDEIGELSLSIQAKLLRVLQSQEFERVGGNQTLRVDVRIVAATNRDLEKEVKAGKFREDLYYRLNVFPLTLPPLRDRASDILLLADHFVEKYAALHSVSVRRISTPAIDLLMSYHWPGNVRELENVIERAVILCNDEVIHAYHLPPSLQSADSSDTRYKGHLEEYLAQVEREFIIDALKSSHGNMAKAARDLGISERIMALRVKSFSINYKIFRKKELNT